MTNVRSRFVVTARAQLGVSQVRERVDQVPPVAECLKQAQRLFERVERGVEIAEAVVNRPS